MSTVRISSKYQIVIPQEVRSALSLKPGQELVFVRAGNSVHLVPVKPLREYQGFLKGMPAEGIREKKDRPV